jgi:recombinational DNA repair ATPase RecF
MLRRFLDWTTLTYSPSRMVVDDAYAKTWRTRREKVKALPIVGRFMRAWEAA